MKRLDHTPTETTRKRLLVDVTAHERRVAVMRGSRLTEILIDRKTGGSLVGHIFLGTVRNILPSQFAFVDIGQGKNAFMNLTEPHTLKAGQPVLVQVNKDASGTKGANVGRSLHVNGRFAIVHDDAPGECGVSQKITDANERTRLRAVAKDAVPEGCGVIVRTNAEGVEADALRGEIQRLAALRASVIERARFLKPPIAVYQENSLYCDLLSGDITEVWVNDPAERARVLETVRVCAPELTERVFFFDEQDGLRLFNAYDAERQIERALQRNVWLPCGGFVTFEQTEACVIVDVNTGKFAGRNNYRETILQTNLEAADCIAEQIALRNLSGMIIVDFIDMREETDRQALVRAFEAAIKKDRVKTAIAGMTELGLMQLTRRKTRESLSRLLECDCPHCGGTGRIKQEGETNRV